MLAGPVLKSSRIETERAVLAMVLDNSRSMTVEDVVVDEVKPISRLEAVGQALKRNRRILDRLADELDVRWFIFDTDLEQKDPISLTGDGKLTAIIDSVDDLQKILASETSQSAGLILVSDGRDNCSKTGDAAVVGEALAAVGIPLYAVGVGSELPLGQTRSLQARRLDCAGQVSILNRLDVHAEFFAAGLAGSTIAVELLFDDKVVEQKEVRPRQVRELIGLDMNYTPTEAGLHRVAVRARAADIPGEQGRAVTTQYVRVVDDKIRVLYIDRPRYERSAISRALAGAKELLVKKLDISQSFGGSGSSLLPAEAKDWHAYQAIVIGDVDRRSFSESALETINDMVINRGRGLVLLGGLRTLGSGQYSDTPLADLLPVDVSVVGHWPAPVAFELTQEGLVHPICQLDADSSANAAAWRRLDPFAGASRLGEVKAAGQVLMESSAGKPLLVVQETGKGRVAAVGFDSTWQWSFADESGAEIQRRFWRQLVFWLVNQRAEVWVTTDKPRYDLADLRSGAETVVVRAGVTAALSDGLADGVAITGVIVKSGGRRSTIDWVKKTEGVEAKITVQEPGTYKVEVAARKGDEEIGQSEMAFVIESVDVELVEPFADVATLQQMAGPTGRIGGRYLGLAKLSDLLARINAAQYTTQVTHVHRYRLVEDYPWWCWLVFLLFLSFEWVIRKRVGLV
jgi:uncharacterized membrane protein